MTVLNRKEYLKYHQELYDMREKKIGIGDTVVINNNYHNAPIIGKVSHFTLSGRVVIRIQYLKKYHYNRYRDPESVVIIRKSKKKCQ